MTQIDRALITGDANGTTSCAGHDMGPKPERFHHPNGVFDLRLGGVGVHYNQHKEGALLTWTDGSWSTSTRDAKIQNWFPEGLNASGQPFAGTLHIFGSKLVSAQANS